MPYFWLRMPSFCRKSLECKGLLCHTDPHCMAYCWGIFFANIGGGGGQIFSGLLAISQNEVRRGSILKFATNFTKMLRDLPDVLRLSLLWVANAPTPESIRQCPELQICEKYVLAIVLQPDNFESP